MGLEHLGSLVPVANPGLDPLQICRYGGMAVRSPSLIRIVNTQCEEPEGFIVLSLEFI